MSVLGLSIGAASQVVCAAVPAKGVMGRPPDLKTRALQTHDEKGK